MGCNFVPVSPGKKVAIVSEPRSKRFCALFHLQRGFGFADVGQRDVGQGMAADAVAALVEFHNWRARQPLPTGIAIAFAEGGGRTLHQPETLLPVLIGKSRAN